MKKNIFYIRVLIIFFFLSEASSAQRIQPPPIDIVFCMDLSGSTNGIIEHLRNHLWHFVHELDQLEPQANYRFGFVGYSRPSFGKDNYYVKVIRDLSYDNELLSSEMFALRTQVEQGSQFVGAALMNCIKNLNWSKEKDAVKIIFLSGNGFVNADGDTYKKACELAVSRGIIIHSLYWYSYTLPR
ncbi:MAG: VWA domain-containing protein, partial [Bacteroidia bacterium]|nr:VWA domain-containing protein [Bacteroidia bacterium]